MAELYLCVTWSCLGLLLSIWIIISLIWDENIGKSHDIMQYNEVCAVVASNIIVMRKNEAGPATAPSLAAIISVMNINFAI